MNYNLNTNFVHTNKLGFAYFRFKEVLVEKINLFHDRWEKEVYWNREGELLNIPEIHVQNR